MKIKKFWSRKVGRKVEDPIASTKSGQVQGFSVDTVRGPVNVYLGIPYAEPPIGSLRFKKTVPVKRWCGIMKCKRYKDRAPQNDFFWESLVLKTGKSEDCLYLNIMAPGWKPDGEKQRFPVLFYIHGGGYVCDSAVRYGYADISKLIVVQGIVVVTLQYRLGYLGFLCTGEENCKGNFGLWDQVVALQWVYDNIEFFGGDPESITVSGQSAGATSADLLALSPYSRDLVRQTFLMGGTAESSWSVCKTEKIIEYCKLHAERLGWRGNSSSEMLEFLKRVPARKLGDGMIGNKIIFKTATLPLGPVIDGDLLPKSIDELRAEAVPKTTVIGVCESEGLLFTALGGMKCNKKDIRNGIELISRAVKSLRIDLNAAVKEVYFKSNLEDMDRRTVQRTFVNMLDDVVTNFSSTNFTEKMVENNGTVYMYCLEYCNPAAYGILSFVMPFVAATHGSELNYLFNANPFGVAFRRNKNDRKVTQIFTTLCANFVKTGDPNGEGGSDDVLGFKWEPVSKEVDYYLSIAPKCQLKSNFKNGRLKRLRQIIGSSRIPV